jgi:hypothetical protein
MPCVGFEPTIPASERAKTVHVLDRSATVTGKYHGDSYDKLTVEIILLYVLKYLQVENKYLESFDDLQSKVLQLASC